MRHLMIDRDCAGLPDWFEAFPELQISQDSTGVSANGEPTIIWCRLRTGDDAERTLRRAVSGKHPVVLLCDEPDDDLILKALAMGAAGCCNSRSTAEVLRQVALVVTNGGLWVGQSLLQRMVGSTARLLAQRRPKEGAQEWKKALSDRENQVAQLVASGESNKEVAKQLNISERTVKAHLTVIFSKLGLRDRLQLAVTVNGVNF